MYLALYNENIGLGGFKCGDCGRVTRTERGIKSHMWVCHGKKVQTEFNFPATELVPDAGREPELGNTGASSDGAIVLYLGGDPYTRHKPECRANIGFGTLPCNCGADMPEVRREGSE